MNSGIAVFMCLVFGADGSLLDNVKFDTKYLVSSMEGDSLVLSDQDGTKIRGWSGDTWSSFICDKYEPAEGDGVINNDTVYDK
jgi:hypothetical protein